MSYVNHGSLACVLRRGGWTSNRAYPADLRDMATGIIRERYSDFGPTLAAEKLAELHDIHLARETVRQWMITAGVWKDRRAPLQAGLLPRGPPHCAGAPLPTHPPTPPPLPPPGPPLPPPPLPQP